MRHLVSFIGLIALASSPAFAQVSIPGVGFTPMINQFALVNPVNTSQTNNGDGTSQPRSTPIIRQARATVLTYRFSRAVSRQNLAKFTEKTRVTDPTGAAKMEALFNSTDIITQLGAAIAPYGLTTSNVADVYTVYWINAWEASRGIVGTQETRGRAQAVKQQAASAMLSTPQMAAATDAQKQEFAEALLVQAALISAYMDDAAGNPAQMKAVAAAVTKGAKAMGLDLSTMTLTERGFVPAGRKRSSVDADDAGAALADASGGDESGPAAALPFALMAAAGGAAFGGAWLYSRRGGPKKG
jgi:hypothetical protein